MLRRSFPVSTHNVLMKPHDCTCYRRLSPPAEFINVCECKDLHAHPDDVIALWRTAFENPETVLFRGFVFYAAI